MATEPIASAATSIATATNQSSMLYRPVNVYRQKVILDNTRRAGWDYRVEESRVQT